jgi:transposase
MRGSDERSGALFSYVDLEARVPAAHPLRTIRVIVNHALRALSPGFHDLYARVGRPSIPPEPLLRALLLQAFYSIRSERQLMERLDFDLLFRWFVGLGIDDQVWHPSTFSKNRDRLLAGDVAAEFLAEVLDQPQVRRLLSSEHFSVDGSLVEASASIKRFRPKHDPDARRAAAATKRRGARPHDRDAIRNATSTASAAPTTATPRPPIPTPGCTARVPARRRSSASSGTC